MTPRRSMLLPLALALTLAGAAAAALGLASRAARAQGAGDVVVYSSRHYGQEPAFEAFTGKTGIKVTMFQGSTGELFERLRAEGERTSADVFLTVDAGNLWNAARAGLLAPMDAPQVEANIPAHLRDPERRWTGLTVRTRTIMYNTKKVNPAELSTYEALGDPKWKGRLCLRPSASVYTQSLIATMIERHGEARTEAIVRAWLANAPHMINSDTKILEAVAAGQCDVAITNHYYLARLLARNPDLPVAPFWANQGTTGTHVNISGAGITTHARNRANAVKFLEFLSSPEAQELFADQSFEYPANPEAPVNRMVAGWGTFRHDDINIAVAGQYQPAAVRLADRVGYK
jgi:iron(III) transport system substrate-binding protein